MKRSEVIAVGVIFAAFVSAANANNSTTDNRSDVADQWRTQPSVWSLVVARTPFRPEELKRREHMAAHDAFSKGWAHLLRKTPEDAAQAIAFFERALQLDPYYSRVYAATAQAYWDNSLNVKFSRLMGLLVGKDDTAVYASDVIAWDFLQKARSEPSSQAHALAARMLQRQRRFDEAMQEARQAIALGPNDPTAYDVLIENLIYAGAAEEALKLVDGSIRLDPSLPGEKLFLKGTAYYTMGRLEEALSHIERARTHNPKQIRYSVIKAAALAELGRVEEAEMVIKEYLSGLTTITTVNWTMFIWPFKDSGTAQRLAKGLLAAGLKDSAHHYYAVAQQNRLTSAQIRELLSAKTMMGLERGYGGLEEEFEVSRNQDVQIVDQAFLTYFRDGETRIENDLLCDPWWEFGDYCVAIYRNPDGTPEQKDEYIFFTLAGIFTFSVFDAVSDLPAASAL
ncbi:MAG: tetratricopeptide repeat protein [Acidiferrobacterales bacterium]